MINVNISGANRQAMYAQKYAGMMKHHAGLPSHAAGADPTASYAVSCATGTAGIPETAEVARILKTAAA